ncbi:ERO1-like protein alpha [Nematocida ausubeli]|uniref:Uncharacterized protein n=1 Tax=Nematocida ausubeli (strain ATCC PRA-371 / ERTm2) TaxID=1913371 RepID=A0A086J0Y1_NEMA1|nr:uncharacterized protein NESG_01783 [Nematocida ausubeli]KAI5137202.1 ERO1-like protein alpha [Nematocida ausubeli]KAI5137404.1 ERO1-like protein alpha [Nematocida ausubeli]KAI5146606.1 ERO1-like protein alpha [Nematocida ausubeli]KAI5162113.1 ERO1-like protein alpha [Nematocida ausubeli]KFG25799.1 hypothetical protein NESG_01783 [Nematocida ausubeli]
MRIFQCTLVISVYFGIFWLGRVMAQMEMYNNLDIRKYLGILCTVGDFSRVEVVIETGCPEIIKRQLKECGVPCDISSRVDSSENSGLSDFRAEIGEKIKMTETVGTKTQIEVDLNTVLERYTGYNGSPIWEYIHKISGSDKLLTLLVGGIHSSVSVHVCAFYNADPVNRRLYMNYKLMSEKLNQEYIRDLRRTMDILISLIPVVLPDIFRLAESEYARKTVISLRNSLPNRRYVYSMYNVSDETIQKCSSISYLMGCVSCLRCKVWGKVQMEGLKCAVKLLRRAQGASLEISDFEVKCFVNLLNRLSISTSQYAKYKGDLEKFQREGLLRQNRREKIVDGVYSMVASPLLMKGMHKGHKKA